jgi:hypothetical protein
VLALADRSGLADLARAEQEHDAGIAEAEGREPPQLGAEVEAEFAPRHDRVDRDRRRELVVVDRPVGVRRERVGERLDVAGQDREPRRGTVPAVALQVLGAGAEPAVQVEGRDRAAGALPRRVGARDQDDGAVVALDEPRRDDADHALVPLGAREHVGAAAALRLGPRLDLRDRLAQDALLDLLSLAVQVLELAREQIRLPPVVGQEQAQRGLRLAEPPGGVDPRREPEAAGALVGGRGVDARDLHQRTQARLLRPPEPRQACERERAVLVDERDDVGDRRKRDQVEVLVEKRMAATEQRLGELPDDAGAAEPRERIVALEGRDDGAVGEDVAGPVVVGDDDLDAERLRQLDLLDGGDAAVDRDDEATAFGGEPLDRPAVQPVALVEAARQVPRDVGLELAQEQDSERGRADAVGVVVAVHADRRAGSDRGADRLDRRGHVSERKRVVTRQRTFEERACGARVGRATPDEHARGRLGDAENLHERAHVRGCAGSDRPAAVDHRGPR